MRLRGLLVAAGLVPVLLLGSLSPAAAHDYLLRIDRAATDANPDAQARWIDTENKICVRAWTGRARGSIIRPRRIDIVVDTAADPGPLCVGFPNIRENKRVKMRLCHFLGDTHQCKARWIRT